ITLSLTDFTKTEEASRKVFRWDPQAHPGHKKYNEKIWEEIKDYIDIGISINTHESTNESPTMGGAAIIESEKTFFKFPVESRSSIINEPALLAVIRELADAFNKSSFNVGSYSD